MRAEEHSDLRCELVVFVGEGWTEVGHSELECVLVESEVWE